MNRLTGRVALVTGSTQGLGEGIALRLGLAGAAVMVNGRSADKGAAVVAKLHELGVQADFVQADLSLREQAAHAVERTATRFGRLDILINNAQTVPPRLEAEQAQTAQLVEIALASGLYASLWTAQAAFPYFRRAGAGRIVNFGSIYGAFGARYHTAYSATKEAIRGLTRTLANEWGVYGITVNAVLPSGISPSYVASFRDRPDLRDAIARKIPLRRHGRSAEDIGAAVVGLVCDEARYITGESLYIDGGAHLNGLPQLNTPGSVE